MRSILKHVVGYSFCIFSLLGMLAAEERSARLVMSELIMASGDEQTALIEEIENYGDPVIAEIYQAWRTGGVYTLKSNTDLQLLEFTAQQEWVSVASGDLVSLSEGDVANVKKERALS